MVRNWLSEKGLSSETCGRLCVLVTRRSASKRPSPLSNAVMKLLPFIRAQIPQHGFTKQGICPGLIAPSLSPKPGNNIGIKAKSQLLFQRSVEGIADRVLPELLRQFRDVGCIDLAVWPPRELFQAALASGCQAAIRKTVFYDFRHIVCAPSELLFELR